MKKELTISKPIQDLKWKFYRDSKPIGDVIEYVKKFLKDNPGTTLFIGCDSSQKGKQVKYVGVIGFRYAGRRGTHLIYTDIYEKYRDLYTRLYLELEFLKLLGLWIEDELVSSGWLRHLGVKMIKDENGIFYRVDKSTKIVTDKKLCIIGIDINPSPEHASNIVYNVAMAMLGGYGFEIYAKPLGIISSAAADGLT